MQYDQLRSSTDPEKGFSSETSHHLFMDIHYPFPSTHNQSVNSPLYTVGVGLGLAFNYQNLSHDIWIRFIRLGLGHRHKYKVIIYKVCFL